MNLQLTPKTLAILMGAVIAVLGMGGWFGLVGAQRSSATSLEGKTADAQANLAALEQTVKAAESHKTGTKAHAKHKADKQATDASLLQVAFPSELQMPSILLQVQHLADTAGVTLVSFAPTTATPQSGYDSVPIDVTVEGRYREIQRFVHALRVQAGSQDGRPQAKGRLFNVETVGITAATEGLPALSATILLDAFVYTGVVPVDASAGSEDAAATPTTAGGTS